MVRWYKRDVKKRRFGWLLACTYFFFFNVVEKNLLIVKKFSKCLENGIACLQKGKFCVVLAFAIVYA